MQISRRKSQGTASGGENCPSNFSTPIWRCVHAAAIHAKISKNAWRTYRPPSLPPGLTLKSGRFMCAPKRRPGIGTFHLADDSDGRAGHSVRLEREPVRGLRMSRRVRGSCELPGLELRRKGAPGGASGDDRRIRSGGLGRGFAPASPRSSGFAGDRARTPLVNPSRGKMFLWSTRRRCRCLRPLL